jgi:microcystin-dependent protein
MSEPAGIVIPFAGNVAPDGWLLCDGSAVSRDTYSDLFEAIGTVYGAGDGSTTFNVPDLSGRVVIGVSNSHALGSTGGEASHTLTEQELPAHSHVVPAHGHANDIKAKTPVLNHTITQPVFKYNRPNTKATQTSYGVNNYTSVNTPTATRSTNLAIANHAAADCTVSGGLGDSDLVETGHTGGSAAHSNMQPYVVISYVISTGGV